MLQPYLAEDDVPRVLATPRYWALQTGNLSSWGQADVAAYIRQELAERIEFLTNEGDALIAEHYRWEPEDKFGGRRLTLTAVVLDTNVLLAHHATLSTTDWAKLLDLLPNTAIGLAIPLQVVRELDRQKNANHNNVNRATKEELRKDAASALRLIEQIEDPSKGWTLRWENEPARLDLLLVGDRIPGEPLGAPDAEIVDRAASLLPFADQVHLVSYDVAIVFRARLAGVKATKLRYGWDSQL